VERYSPEEEWPDQRFPLRWPSAAFLGLIGCAATCAVGFILGASSATAPPQDPAPPRILYRFLPMPDEKDDAPGVDALRPATSPEDPCPPKKTNQAAGGKRAGRG